MTSRLRPTARQRDAAPSCRDPPNVSQQALELPWQAVFLRRNSAIWPLRPSATAPGHPTRYIVCVTWWPVCGQSVAGSVGGQEPASNAWPFRLAGDNRSEDERSYCSRYSLCATEPRESQGGSPRIGVRHGGCSSVVEHWIVAPVVAGSIPVTHPNSNPAELCQRIAWSAIGSKRQIGENSSAPRERRRRGTSSAPGMRSPLPVVPN